MRFLPRIFRQAVVGIGQVTATSLAPTAPLVTGTPSSSSGGSSTVNLYNPATGRLTGTVVPFPGFSGPGKVASLLPTNILG